MGPRVLAATAAISLVLGLAAASPASANTTVKLDIAPPVQPAQPVTSANTVDPLAHGAIPSDGVDDTAALQRAIDAANQQGGGTVALGAGQYDLSIVSRGPAREDTTSLRLRSNVALVGKGAGVTTVRLADAQGNYWSIFDTDPLATTTDVELRDFTVDQNTSGNPVLAVSDIYGSSTKPVQPRFVLRHYSGGRVLVDSVEFTNVSSGNVLSFNRLDASVSPPITDVTVQRSRFTRVGGGTVDFDHSTIYTRGDRMRIADNEFISTNGAGTLNARTAIETHNSDQTVVGNRINGYAKGINATGYGETNRRHLYANNTMTNVGLGIFLWSVYRTAPTPPLEQVEVANNDITIDVDGWAQSRVGVVNAGILGHPDNNTSVTNTAIHHNRITFTNDAVTRNDATELYDAVAAGIALWSRTGQPVRNITISDNTITNPLSSGIWTNTAIHGTSEIANNTITNPGRMTNLDKTWPTPLTVPYRAEYRSGIALDVAGDMPVQPGRLVVRNNHTIHTDPTIDLHAGVWASSCWLNVCQAQDSHLTSAADRPAVDLPATWRVRH